MANKNAEGLRVFAGRPAGARRRPIRDAVDHARSVARACSPRIQDPWGLNRLCTITDRADGNTAIEVYNSERTTVNVIAECVNEGILRDTFANFATGAVGADHERRRRPRLARADPDAAQPGRRGRLRTGRSLADAKARPIHDIKSPRRPSKKVLHKIRFARVVTPFHGKRPCWSCASTARPGMVGAPHHDPKPAGSRHTYTRFVPANRKIAVKNLPIPAKTAKVTVSLIGL